MKVLKVEFIRWKALVQLMDQVRYIVFLKGCHMRCRYCHNPETWKEEGGTLETAQEVFDKAYRYRNYWKNGGGITVSGGEALLQMEFVTELFEIAKRMVCTQLLIHQVILLRWSRISGKV